MTTVTLWPRRSRTPGRPDRRRRTPRGTAGATTKPRAAPTAKRLIQWLVHRLARRLSSRLRGDDGVAAVWIILAVPVVAIVVGFVLDTSIAVYDWNTAHDNAASAARAGAQQIDLARYRDTGVIQLDPTAAAQAARQYLAGLGATGTVAATADTVTVSVTRTTPNQMLSLIGVSSFTEHATVAARPLHGVDGPAP